MKVILFLVLLSSFSATAQRAPSCGLVQGDEESLLFFEEVIKERGRQLLNSTLAGQGISAVWDSYEPEVAFHFEEGALPSFTFESTISAVDGDAMVWSFGKVIDQGEFLISRLKVWFEPWHKYNNESGKVVHMCRLRFYNPENGFLQLLINDYIMTYAKSPYFDSQLNVELFSTD